MRKPSTKWVPKRQRCQSSKQFWNFFGAIQTISDRDWWPWTKPGYITMTRRQSNNQCSGGREAHPAPKNSECKNPLEKLSPQFLGVKTASSSLIMFQKAKLSKRSITHLCWCNWRTFCGKTPREVHQSGLVLARHCPGSPVTCNPEEIGLPRLPVFWSPTYSPDLAPSDYHLFPGLKKQLKGRHFWSDTEPIAAAEAWLDGQPFWIF